MERVKLIIPKEQVIHVCNHINEKYIDDLHTCEYIFEKGKIYGLVGEHGSGGEAISSLLSGKIKLNDNIVQYDDLMVDDSDIQMNGWYVGKAEYSELFVKKEISVRKALEFAIKKYCRYSNIDEIIEDFHLTPDRLDYELCKYSGERLRASLAIGYASNKKIFCFPWMNTAYFHDIILSSGVFRLFKKLTNEDCIIILTTSRVENVIGLVDEVIEINNPRFRRVISQNDYFIEHFT